LDQSPQRNGRLVVHVRFGSGFVVPAAAPLNMAVRFGTESECASAHFNGPLEAQPRCRAHLGRLNCF
jgi:hypothetical protein